MNQKTVLSYTLTDGNGFDEDHIINGKIVDPIYIGLLAGSTTPPSDGAGGLASTGVNYLLIIGFSFAALILGLSIAFRRRAL